MVVAETILGVVLSFVISKLASPEVIGYFRRCKFDKSLVNKLKLTMLATGKLLVDAEQKQMTDNAVNEWLDELKHWFYRAEEVIDEIATKALRASLKSSMETPSLGSKVRKFVPNTYNSIKSNRNIDEKIREIVSMLESMLAQKDVLGLKEISDGGAYVPAPRDDSSVMEDSKVYGRDQEKEKLLDLLLSFEEPKRNNFDVVAIWGMGGIGKTTLAKILYNDPLVQNVFDLKAWVCVSHPFDVARVTRSILDSVTNTSCSSSLDLNFLQTKLRSELRNKKFILVLDDVWNENYGHWQTLQAPFSAGTNGSKIIVTARNEGVAYIMCTKPPFKLNLLSDDDAWSVFSRHAFELGNVMVDPCLNPIGRKIVQKCGGLPLAIIALGGLLRWKRDSKYWEAILQSSLWDLRDSSVIPALWLSYYYLPGHLKRCFSYCAIFPKDYKINRNQLVRLWMAENFLQPTDNQRSVEDEGENFLHQLVAKSFLEPGDESYVTMHDLMHDLAQGVSGNFLAGQGLGTPAKIPERARRFSYLVDASDTCSKFQAIDRTKYLRSFLSIHQDEWPREAYLTNKVSTILKRNLSCLRVLSLSGYQNLGWLELIECPKQLRYLDISGTNITLLPRWLGTLCKLQTLILSNCTDLERLPADMWKLVSLRHLDIRGATKLTCMPEQISKLTNLQTLTDFIVGHNTGSGIQELRELIHIHGKLAIRGLQNVNVPRDTDALNLSSRKLIEDIELDFFGLQNGDSNKHKKVLESLKPPSDVKRLAVKNYMGLTFPWLDPIPECPIYKNMAFLCLQDCQYCISFYKNMAFLCLQDCQYCISLPPLGQLPSLKVLEIEGMHSIKEVGHEFYGHAMCDPFPTLESLSFKNMKGWEVWSHVDAEGCAVCLPCLTYLNLNGCPNLKGNLPVHAPSLVNLNIKRCGQLSQLLPQLASVYALEMATNCHNPEFAKSFNVSSITRLKLEGLVQVASLPPELVTLSSLHILEISDCDNLKSLANLELPPMLETLDIERCGALECLPKRMEVLIHLQNIYLSECPCLRWAPENSLPTSLKALLIISCEFRIPMDMMKHYTSLEVLHLENVGDHLASFPLGSFPNLRSLYLENCKGLEKVYIPEGIDDNSLTSLDFLYIYGCPKLEMVGKERGSGEATVLPTPNLKWLYIQDCEKVKAVAMIGRGGEILLPKLTGIRIGSSESNKMMSESGLSVGENLVKFSWLRSLEVRDEEVECFPDPNQQGWGSLPTSLTSLTIKECPKLRKLDGKALQSLKHLQELTIRDCPKLERLPEEGLPPSLAYLTIAGCPKLERLPEEGLPSSLGFLWIKGCPKLEERCKGKKGKDSSKIHHIPQVRINSLCITDGTWSCKLKKPKH